MIYRLDSNSPTVTTTALFPKSWTATTSAICPDLLRYEQIGTADGLRGRVIRFFFLVMKLWPPR